MTLLQTPSETSSEMELLGKSIANSCIAGTSLHSQKKGRADHQIYLYQEILVLINKILYLSLKW